MEIVPYSAEHRRAVDRFNARMAKGGSEWRFPVAERAQADAGASVWNEAVVAVDGDEVCGGYILKHQEFFIEGRTVEVGSLQLPISLGEIASEFAHVSVALLFDAIRRTPFAYSLGLGSEDTQFARLLTAARWQHVTVPFFFSVKSGNAFARNIRLPENRARTEKALRALARLRLAGAALRLRALRSKPRKSPRAASGQGREVADFEDFADEVFTANVESYAFVGDRRAAALGRIFPTGDERYLRLRIERGEETIGWALVLDIAMNDDKHFGDMRVGSIVDGFSSPDDAAAVVASADEYLTDRGVDVIVSNQLHPSWCGALEDAGYERGPSNFFFYFSEELANRLATIDDWEERTHLNRGDGEGPGHLLGS